MASIPTNWRSAYYLAERHASPRIESLTRTGAILDAIALLTGARRATSRTLRRAGSATLEGLGVPSGRQVARVQRALDSLDRHALAIWETREPAGADNDPRAGS